MEPIILNARLDRNGHEPSIRVFDATKSAHLEADIAAVRFHSSVNSATSEIMIGVAAIAMIGATLAENQSFRRACLEDITQLKVIQLPTAVEIRIL